MKSRFYIYYAIKSRPGPFIKQSIPSNFTLDHNGKFELYVIINSIQVGLTDVTNGSIIVVNCFLMISHRFFSIPSSSHKRMTLPLKSMAKHLWHQKKTNRWFRDKHLKECDQMQACSGGRSKRKYRQRSPFGVFISNKSGRLWNISIRMPLVLQTA